VRLPRTRCTLTATDSTVILAALRTTVEQPRNEPEEPGSEREMRRAEDDQDPSIHRNTRLVPASGEVKRRNRYGSAVPRDPRKNRILGDRCAICPRCGYGRRYLVGVTVPAHERCPDCGAELVVACPACGETIESVMQVDCRACGTPLRPAELFGTVIRRKAEPASTPIVDDDA